MGEPLKVKLGSLSLLNEFVNYDKDVYFSSIFNFCIWCTENAHAFGHQLPYIKQHQMSYLKLR